MEEYSSMVTSARTQPLLVEEKPPPSCSQTSAPESQVSERSISWETSLRKPVMAKRLEWGQMNMEKTWCNTVFSDVAMFGLRGNRIKYFEMIDRRKKGCEIFWGFRSLYGSNIMTTLVSCNASEMAEVWKSKVVGRINHSDDTIQYLDIYVTQFNAKVLKNTVNEKFSYSVWPFGAKDLSPICHAWKLVGEKVKNIPCSSKEEMISIVSGVWEKDLDVKLMCSEVISLLPNIIKSVVHWEGSFPMDNVRYVVTS